MCYWAQIPVLNAQWGQTNWNVVWAEKGLLQGWTRRAGGLCSKTELSDGLGGEAFYFN